MQEWFLDGPFAETKEQLLGFYVVDCPTLEAAVAAARDLRHANPTAVYEIRPVSLYRPGAPLTAQEENFSSKYFPGAFSLIRIFHPVPGIRLGIDIRVAVSRPPNLESDCRFSDINGCQLAFNFLAVAIMLGDEIECLGSA